MNNITRYDPFSELARFDPLWDMDDVFNRFMMRPVVRSGMEIEPQIKMDEGVKWRLQDQGGDSGCEEG